MKRVIILILLAVSSISYSQSEIVQREPFALKLIVNDKEPYEMNVAKGDYFVQKKILQIYPSEKLNIEVEVKSDTIYSMKVVDQNVNPKKTIRIEFIQNVKNDRAEGMTLAIQNPFDKKLNYDAAMFVVGHNKELVPTTVLPIQPNKVNLEKWDDVIVTLVLDKWRFEN